jgi:hypothetical protein
MDWYNNRVLYIFFVNEDIFMLEFKQRVIDTFLNEAISFFEESPKCHFYKYIYDDHNLQFYLSRPVNYMTNFHIFTTF